MQYPVVTVDLKKIRENYRYIKNICDKAGIDIVFVIKGFNAIPEAVRSVVSEGAKTIGTSRISQFKKLEGELKEVKRMHLRIPSDSELENVVKYTDIGLNSEISTIEKINEEAKRQNKIYDIILMVELGDLREGFWNDEELKEAVEKTEFELENVNLKGIGTNLSCYGSTVATREKMDKLVEKAKFVEKIIDRKLDIISGGGTTSLPRVLENDMPKEINMLRIGEGIILSRDLKEIYGYSLEEMHSDVFVLEAEVVEVKEKPSHPIGELISDGFGLTHKYEDRGIRKRAILNLGKVDFGYIDMIQPLQEGVEILGASSDHTILDVENAKEDVKVGDIIKFSLSYANVVYLTSSNDVEIKIVE